MRRIPQERRIRVDPNAERLAQGLGDPMGMGVADQNGDDFDRGTRQHRLHHHQVHFERMLAGEWPRVVADPPGQDRRTTAPDRHARGDERDPLSAAHRLPLALSAPRSLPPRSTVYNIFRKLQHEGVWEAIWEELRAALRERLGRETSPSAGVIDSQSLKSAEKGNARKVKQTQWVMTRARR
jgi:transposase